MTASAETQVWSHQPWSVKQLGRGQEEAQPKASEGLHSIPLQDGQGAAAVTGLVGYGDPGVSDLE